MYSPKAPNNPNSWPLQFTQLDSIPQKPSLILFIFFNLRRYALSHPFCLSKLYQMLIKRSSILLTKTLHLRFFSQSAALLQEPESPLTYLDGFPKPDPKYDETIHAVPRSISGKNISAKERKAGRVPSIVFEQEDGQHGGNKRLISVHTNQIKKLVNHLGRSFFLSRLFDLEVRPEFGSDQLVEKVRVLPRSVSMCTGFLSFVISLLYMFIFLLFDCHLFLSADMIWVEIIIWLKWNLNE